MWETIQDFLIGWYPWIKSFHIIAVITWMAGIFYLPRLFVYHTEGYNKSGVQAGSDIDLLFQRQERLLLRAIMNPAMIATVVFGTLLFLTPGIINWAEIWPWTKLIGVVLMINFHMWLGARRKDFVNHTNKVSGKMYRILNEVPVVLLAVIVFSVVVKF